MRKQALYSRDYYYYFTSMSRHCSRERWGNKHKIIYNEFLINYAMNLLLVFTSQKLIILILNFF
jgi:hypothetical protein